MHKWLNRVVALLLPTACFVPSRSDLHRTFGKCKWCQHGWAEASGLSHEGPALVLLDEARGGQGAAASAPVPQPPSAGVTWRTCWVKQVEGQWLMHCPIICGPRPGTKSWWCLLLQGQYQNWLFLRIPSPYSMGGSCSDIWKPLDGGRMQQLELLERVTCEMTAEVAMQNLSFYWSACLKGVRRWKVTRLSWWGRTRWSQDKSVCCCKSESAASLKQASSPVYPRVI